MPPVKTKTFPYVMAGIPALILVLALSGTLILHHFLPGKVAGFMKKEFAGILEGEVSGLYWVEIPEVQFTPLFRTMHVQSVLLVPDTHALADRSPEALPAGIFRLRVGGLEVSTGGLLALARGKKDIVFSTVRIGELSATLIRNPDGRQPEKEGGTHHLRSLEIKDLAVTLTDLKVQMLAEPGTDVFSLDQGRFNTGILWQSGKYPDTPVLDLRKPDLLAASIDIRAPDALHRFTCASLALERDGTGLNLFGVKMVPLFSKRQFRNQVTHQANRVETELDTVRFHGFDLNSLINRKHLSAEKLEVSHGRVEVFRDRHPPLNTLQRPPMPVRLIREAPFEIRLGEASLTGLDVYYQELPRGSAAESVIPFRNLSATLTNLTNAAEHLIHDSIMRIQSHAWVFGRSRLNASFVYNLKDLNGGYRAHGTLAAMPLDIINPVLYPITGIRVIEGSHEKTEFFFSGNDFRTEGALTMHYSGLRLDLAPERNRLRQTIANWAGRQFMYHPSNPGNHTEVRPGTIYFEREADRFVFHYWWNSFLTGVLSTVMRDRVNRGGSE